MNSSVRSEALDPSVGSFRHVFRGIEYVVTLMIDSDKETFVLEVEDRLTSDQWRGQFDARCKLKVNIQHVIVEFRVFVMFDVDVSTPRIKGKGK